MSSRLRFQKVSSANPVADYLSQIITKQLNRGKKVLWLVPGGSALKIASMVGEKLLDKNLDNLTVSLSDERYGPIGHKNSNWQQLKDAGFNLKGATLIPVLDNKSLSYTALRYDKVITDALDSNDYKLALIGFGTDGHIAGIKPNSPSVNSQHLAAGYKWDDFTRLTITPKALMRLDEVVVYMTGEEKWPQIDRLSEDITIKEQPAQILKKLKKVIIFSDCKGEPM